MHNQFLKFFGDGQIWKELSQLTNSIQKKMKTSKVSYCFTQALCMQLNQIIFFSVLVDENDPTPANYIVLKDTDCFGYDVHNNRPRPALTLNACIQQC